LSLNLFGNSDNNVSQKSSDSPGPNARGRNDHVLCKNLRALHVGEDASANDEVGLADILALFRVRVTALSRFLKAQYCTLDDNHRDGEPRAQMVYTGRMVSVGPRVHARHIGIGQ
jgi:hypothetical protein